MILSAALLMMLLAFSSCDDSQEATGRVFGSAYDIWEDLYELIIKDYISDVYSDVIETFLGASIKLFGWAAFGSFLVIKGAWLNSQEDLVGNIPSYYGQGRAAPLLSLTGELTGRSQTEGPVNFTLPYLDQYLGLRLTFPVDNSLQGCYSARQTCLDNDLGGEVSHLLTTWSHLNTFLAGWLEVGQRLLTSREEEDTVDVEEEFF